MQTRPAGLGRARRQFRCSAPARMRDAWSERGCLIRRQRSFVGLQRIPTRLHSTPVRFAFIVSYENRWAAVLPRVVMGVFPFAATTWDIASPVRVRSGWVRGPAWRWRLHSPLRPPRFDPIPMSAAARQTPLALGRFVAYIQRVAFSRIPVRSLATGGSWVAPIERGPPAFQPVSRAGGAGGSGRRNRAAGASIGNRTKV
jgi:hypothetical protein